MQTKIALVTGAGKRIGQAIAVNLAELGYDILVHYNASESGAKETKLSIEKLGRKAHLVQADMAELYAPREIISELEHLYGRLDLLINSASTFPEPNKLKSKYYFVNETEENWEETLAVNSRAPFFLIKHGAKLLTKSNSGLVINILDESILQDNVSRVCHAISKSTLKNITELAACNFGDKFRVCSLLLGQILPGEKMSKEEVDKINWIGVEPVVEKIREIIELGKNGEMYLVN